MPRSLKGGGSRGNAIRPEAGAWLQRHINPAHGPLGAAPIPDHTSVPSVVAEFRETLVLNTPTPGSTDTWNADFLVMPASNMFGLHRAWSTTAGQGDTFAGLTSWAPPSIVAGAYRFTHVGITIELVANALSDQGTVYAGQTNPNICLDVGQSLAAAAMAVAGPAPPQTTQTLVRDDPRHYQGLAKGGVYMPLKLAKPMVPYQQTVQTGRLIWRNEAGTPFNVGVNGQAFGFTTNDLCTYNVGVILFRGLSSTATLMVRTRLGIEATDAYTAWYPFVRPSAMLDECALEAAALASQSTPNGYPASANDFWTILRAIGAALRGRVSQRVADALAAIGVPILSPAAALAGDLMRAW